MSIAGVMARDGAEAGPMHGPALWAAATALALGTFMQVLDVTIANVSLPTIAGNLGASTDQATWVITSFTVANGIGVPLTGWLMNRYGVVRTFAVSVLAFTAASFLCGVAWSLPSLVFFRALQGAVSGPMIPGSQALMLSIFPQARRATALGIWSITTLVAPICGPILGGYISDSWHWGWIFLINVPVGLAVGMVCWTMLRTRETQVRKLPIDTVGLALLIVWAGSLQVVLDTGRNAGWWDSPHILALCVIAAIGFIAFLIWELTEEHPIVDLSLFKNRNFALGTIIFCLGNGVFFANMILMPLWLQTQLGYTATWAGLVSAPTGAVAVLLTPVAAGLMARTDARLVASISFAAAAASYFLRAGLTNDASFFAIAVPLMVQGIASASFFIALVIIILDGLPQERIPDASGLANFVRIIGSGFAASIVTTLWDNREALHQSRLADVTTAYAPQFNAALAALRALGLEDMAAKAAITRGMVGQAYLLASLDVFTLSAWLCIGLVALAWLCHRPASGAAMPAAE